MIGISSSVDANMYFENLVSDMAVTALEVNLKKTFIPYDLNVIKEKVCPLVKNIDLSVHSTPRFFFATPEILGKSQVDTLKAELLLAASMGAKELVMHIEHSNFSEVRQNLSGILLSVLDLVKENKIELLVENSSKSLFSKEEELHWLFDKFSELKMCLDVGHLNVAINKHKIDVEKFITSLGNKIVNVHVHGNNGNSDMHRALLSEDIEIINILKIIIGRFKVRKYIVESIGRTDAKKTIDLLRQLGAH